MSFSRQKQQQQDEFYMLFRQQALHWDVNKDLKLGHLLENLSENLRQLCVQKNTRYVANQISKYTSFNKRLRDFIYFQHQDNTYRDISLEFLLRRIILASIRHSEKRREPFFKPDRILLESLEDLDGKLEEQSIGIMGDKFRNLKLDILQRETEVRYNIFAVEQTLLRSNKKHQFAQFRQTQQFVMTPTIHKLQSNVNLQLARTEEKLNEFRFIKKKTRSYACNLDEVANFLDENKLE